MTTLIVIAHPDPGSLTHHIAGRLVRALHPAVTETADLSAEGFDPRFTTDDRHTYRSAAGASDDISAEQRRIDAADHLVLVFPVHWWSMPALLKGWIDRVFVNGWAFDIDPEADIRRNLDRLTMHLVPVAGEDEGVYERHGYRQALNTQISHGIIDYCGMRRGVTAFVHESERDDHGALDQAVADAVGLVAGEIAGR